MRKATFSVALGTICVFSIVARSLGTPDESLGKKLFESKCVSCHGKDAKGSTKAGKATKTPDLVEKPWKYGTAQAEVERVVRKGVGKMPKYEGKLSDKEIEAVAAYTRKLAAVDK